MTSKSRKITAIIFIAIIFSFGAITLWNCRSTVKDIVKTNNYLHCKKELEASLDENIGLKNQWINANGLLHRMMLERIVRGSGDSYDVYKLKNGQIMYSLPKKDMTKYAKKVSDLNKALSDMNIGFLYVQLPNKIKDNSYMPVGAKSYGNENADELVSLLKKENIDCIDIRDNIEKEGRDWSSLFFKTDHHWLPTTGLWASGIIMEHIGEKYNFPIDKKHYSYDSYSSEMHKDWMLGAVGRRVGVTYAGLDDIEILKPKFDTKFTFVGKSDEGITKRQGSFYDSMYYWKNLEKRADFINNSYSTYIGKEFSISTIDNKLKKGGLKILLIRDSFSCAITPFISLDSKISKSIDLRRYKKSVLLLCEEYRPDVVIVAYNPSAFSNKQFKFIK